MNKLSKLLGALALAVAGAALGQTQPALYYIHSDQLNTPRLIANSNGTTVWRWDQQEPFANNAPDENPSGLGAFEFPIRFPGQYFDKETSVSYNYMRQYDPSVGRYLETDPIGLSGGINLYAYADQDPLRRFDRYGMQADSFGDSRGRSALGWPNASADATRRAAMQLTQLWNKFKEACWPSESDEEKKKRCLKEWERASEVCADLLSEPPHKRNRRKTGGHTDMLSCMKGYVSQECGGNKVD